MRYALAGEGRTGLASSDLIALYREWLDAYPLVSIEDGLAEDDWDGWKQMTAELGGRVQIVGDDLFVTNPEILAQGIAEGLANALLVKVNQIGTLTETLEAVEMAKTHAYANITQPPLGGDRGHHHRRPGGRHPRGADQDRRPVPQRPRRQVQPSAAHRRGAGGRGHLSRGQGLPPLDTVTRARSARPERFASAPCWARPSLLVFALLAIAALKSNRDLAGGARPRAAADGEDRRHRAPRASGCACASTACATTPACSSGWPARTWGWSGRAT